MPRALLWVLYFQLGRSNACQFEVFVRFQNLVKREYAWQGYVLCVRHNVCYDNGRLWLLCVFLLRHMVCKNDLWGMILYNNYASVCCLFQALVVVEGVGCWYEALVAVEGVGCCGGRRITFS